MQGERTRDWMCLAAWMAIGMVVATGCSTEVAKDQGKKPPQGSDTVENDPKPEEAPVTATATATVVDGAGYRALLEKHLGSVVFVDYWATW